MKKFLVSIALCGYVTVISAITAEDINALKERIETKAQISIADVVELPLTVIPTTVLKDLIITNLAIEESVPGFERGFIVRGIASIRGIQAQIRLLLVDYGSERGFSLGLFFPNFLDVLKIIPQLAFLDNLTMPSPKLVLSSFSYQDQELNAYLIEGLNFTTSVAFQGPFDWVGELIRNKARLTDAFVFQAEHDFVITAYLSEKLENTSFNGTLPIRLGIDLTKIKKIPESVSDVIQKITSDDLVVTISPPPDSLLGLGAGVRIYLGTQEGPLSVYMAGAVSDQTSYMRGSFSQIDFKWFALEDVALQINWDTATMAAAAAVGIPFTGIEMRGTLALGKAGKDRASFSVGGKASLEGDVLSGLAFLGEAKNVGISTFIHYIAQKINRPLTQKQLPEITFDTVKVAFAVKDTNVAGELYPEGLVAEGAITFWGKNGILRLAYKPTKFVLEGLGYIENIDAKIFRITGAGLDKKRGTEDDGPIIKLLASATALDRSGIFIDGQFVIPALGFSHDTQFESGIGGLQASFKTQLQGLFTSDFTVRINKNFDDLLFEYRFEQGFLDYLTDQMSKGISRLREKAEKKLANVTAELNAARESLERAQGRGVQKVSDEMARADERIRNAQQDLNRLRDEHRRDCRGIRAIRNAGKCIRITAEMAAKGAELAGLKTYRETLLRPGKTVVRETVGAAATIVESVNRIEVAQNLTRGSLDVLSALSQGVSAAIQFFEVKKAHGRITGEDLRQGKLATFSLDIEVEIPPAFKKRITLENIAINFADVKGSTKTIANQVVQALERELTL